MEYETKLWTPKDLANRFKVSTETLRLWESTGKLKSIKTKGGHRRYILSDPVPKTETHEKRKVIYARVSSSKQRNDLERQVELLLFKYPTYEVVRDVGSGIGFKRRGFVSLLESVLRNEVQTIVVAHKDRLCRFGFDLLHLIGHSGAPVFVRRSHLP